MYKKIRNSKDTAGKSAKDAGSQLILGREGGLTHAALFQCEHKKQNCLAFNVRQLVSLCQSHCVGHCRNGLGESSTVAKLPPLGTISAGGNELDQAKIEQ